MEKSWKKFLIVFSLLVLALFVVSACAPGGETLVGKARGTSFSASEKECLSSKECGNAYAKCLKGDCAKINKVKDKKKYDACQSKCLKNSLKSANAAGGEGEQVSKISVNRAIDIKKERAFVKTISDERMRFMLNDVLEYQPKQDEFIDSRGSIHKKIDGQERVFLGYEEMKEEYEASLVPRKSWPEVEQIKKKSIPTPEELIKINPQSYIDSTINNGLVKSKDYMTGSVIVKTEICDNYDDDDGDGMKDCGDPDCGGGYSRIWFCVEEKESEF